MTGHLVLSTLHTNTAVGAVSRLLDMGVERYLLAPMLRGLVAQRLGRRLCPDCREPHPLSARDAALLGHAMREGAPAYHAPGCDACSQEGYRGRLPIYEVVEGTTTLEQMIHDGDSEADLIAEARRASTSILDDGIAKIKAGLTSAEDVARAVRDRA